MTHQLSIWPCTADLEFSDSAPAFETGPLTETAARWLMEYTPYWLAKRQDPNGPAPAYLLSLDCLDDDGIGICQDTRHVAAE